MRNLLQLGTPAAPPGPEKMLQYIHIKDKIVIYLADALQHSVESVLISGVFLIGRPR